METSTILDQPLSATPDRRRKLLPWWIKTFSWIFMVTGIIVPLALIATLVNFSGQLAMYGFETTDPGSPVGLFICAIFLIKAIVSYGLWFEKDWAIIAGLVDAIIGIATCLVVMFPFIEALQPYNTSFRLEILFLALFMWKLLRIRQQWTERKG